jgi:hypothetical protein
MRELMCQQDRFSNKKMIKEDKTMKEAQRTNRDLMDRINEGVYGTKWRAGREDDTCVDDMLAIVSGDKIDNNAELYYHLMSNLRRCNDFGVVRNPEEYKTYREILDAFKEKWDVLKAWSIPYRVLHDIYVMDNMGNCI